MNEQLELQDKFSEVLLLQAPVQTEREPISLPAALCDDALLNEINSIPEKSL